MKFEHPDSGETRALSFTPELGARVAAARGNECSHHTTEVRERAIRGGGKQFRHQCLNCGEAVGNPLKGADHPNAKEFDELLLQGKIREERLRIWNAINIYENNLNNRDLDFQKKYDTYLSGPVWREKRGLVLRRANSTCEGCMRNKASEVHHLTYKHIFDEFLFELVALCNICHGRLHNDRFFDEDDDRKCRGCRYQGDGQICPVFDVPEVTALHDPNYCGPDFSGFSPLK